MPDGVATTIRSRTRNRIVAWSVCYFVVAMLGVMTRGYITRFVLGPVTADEATLDPIDEIGFADWYFVAIHGAKSIDTGLRLSSTDESGATHDLAGYYAVPIGRRVLIYKSINGPIANPEGVLDESPRYTAEFERIANRIGSDRVYPFILDTTQDFRFLGYVAIGALVVLGWMFWKHGLSAFRHLGNLDAHPVLARIQAWPPEDVSELERILREGGLRRARWTLKGDFVIYDSLFFSFDAVRLADLLWAYKGVVKHSINFVPTHKTYAAHFVCIGGHAAVGGTEPEVEEMLRLAADRAPWAVFGYSDDLARKLKKKPQGFADALEKRKAELASQAKASATRSPP